MNKEFGSSLFVEVLKTIQINWSLPSSWMLLRAERINDLNGCDGNLTD